MKQIFFVLCFFVSALAHAAVDYGKVSERAIETLRNFVKADTEGKDEEKVVKYVKKRLDSADIPYEVSEFAKGRKNIVARLKGNGKKKPMLILAHSDVVPTQNQNWETPPHEMTEKADGYLYGRGVVDDLGYAAIATEILVELKNSKTPLDRDIILAITGDEEKGGAGVKEIIADHHNWIADAEFALNEGAATLITEDGVPRFALVAPAEKSYQDFKLTTTGKPGHSSIPEKDNAIYRMAAALEKLGKHQEPVEILPVVENYFRGRAIVEKDPKLKKAFEALAKNSKHPSASAMAMIEAVPSLASMIRTTCVATVVQGGATNMRNVLPAMAEANVNCRMMPGTKASDIEKHLIAVIKDPGVKVERHLDFGESDASPLNSPVLRAAMSVGHEMFPTSPIVPTLLQGASDSRFLRQIGIPTYGLSPLFITEEDRSRVHGANERLRKKSVAAGAEFFHKVILQLAGGQAS